MVRRPLRISLGFLFLLHVALAQGSDVNRIRLRMLDSIGRTQNFMCAQTVNVSGIAAPNALPPLTLEAGIVDGKELYRQPTVPADLRGLSRLLELYEGAGTGSYALFSRQVFLTTAASFYAAPEETVEGRKLVRWDFKVPREASRLTLPSPKGKIAVPYSGTFWSDPGSQDIVRLDLAAGDLPTDAKVRNIAQTIQWKRVGIAAVSVLLPSASEFTIVGADGQTVRGEIQYQGCEKYVPAEVARLIELSAGPAAAAAAPDEPWLPLPPKSRLEFALETPIDEKSTPVNDTVTLRLTKDLKQDGKVIVPKGASASVRITRLGRQQFRQADAWRGYYIVGLVLETIGTPEQRYRVRANLEVVGPSTTRDYFLPFSQSPDKWGGFEEVRDFFSFPQPQPGESILGLVREYCRVPKALRMVYVTTPSGS